MIRGNKRVNAHCGEFNKQRNNQLLEVKLCDSEIRRWKKNKDNDYAATVKRRRKLSSRLCYLYLNNNRGNIHSKTTQFLVFLFIFLSDCFG